MCDALSRNVHKEYDVILMNCIAHSLLMIGAHGVG